MVATKTTLTGGNGSRHSGEAFGDAYELPPDRAYNETCAAIASFQWSWRLLLATGDAKYADLMERVLYNGFGAAVSADGQRFFYVNPLQRRPDHFEDDDPGRRREWFSCACCPPNIMRLVASLEHYVATVAGDVLYLHQLAESRIAAPLAGRHAQRRRCHRLSRGTARSSSPSRGAPDAECGLAVRVPGWSRDISVRMNGEPLRDRSQRPRVPGDPSPLAIRRRAHLHPGPHAEADLPEQVRRRASAAPSRSSAGRSSTASSRPTSPPGTTSRISRSAPACLTERAGDAAWDRPHRRRRGAAPSACRQPAYEDCPTCPTPDAGPAGMPGDCGGHPLLPMGQPRRPGHAGLDASWPA